MLCNRSYIGMLFILTIFTGLAEAAPASVTIVNDANQSVIRQTNLPNDSILNLTFKSDIDGSIQPMLVKVPKGYSPKKAWPLLVTLHGLGDGPILATEVDSMVQIGPYGRGSVWYSGIGERDVFECIEVAKKIFSIDMDRVYLCGFSMGGAGVFDLGLKYPDFWTACVPVCGRCQDATLVENGRRLPFWINTGKLDTMVPPQYSKKAYDKARELGFTEWKYTEYENMGHGFSIDWKQIENWLLTKKRGANPKRISYCTKELNRVYWVEITDVEEYGKIARIDVVIENQKINIKTDNISNYTLRLNNNLVDLSKEIQIIENGVSVFAGFLSKDGCFVKVNRNNDTIFKHPGLSGPLWDVYSSSAILVYGTNSKNELLIQAARNCAESFCNPRWMDKVDFQIIPDTTVSESDVSKNNLVLFGNTETNKILADISDKLPIKMNSNEITAKGVSYSGDNIGYVLIYPNPLNSKKYVVVFSGNSPDAINCFDRIWPRFGSIPKSIDFGVFEIVSGSNSVVWRLEGVFGTDWNWQDFRADH